jgi:putative ABC transport system substrate-binding protein
MRRREAIGLIGGAAIAWPIVAEAQRADRPRRVGILMPLREGDPQSQVRLTAFTQTLRQIGWIEEKTIAAELILIEPCLGSHKKAPERELRGFVQAPSPAPA